MWVANIPENVASVIDNALWDLAGRAFNTAGLQADGRRRATRSRPMPRPIPISACRASMPSTRWPARTRATIAYKIHPHYFWNPETGQPTPGRPSNIKADIETIHLVREAVGPDYVLMFDPWGTYMTPRGSHQGRPRARKAQLLLVRAPDAGIPGRELCAAVAASSRSRSCRPKSSPAACSPAPSGSCAAPAT